ncbi:Transcriptional regulatory protein ZraR [Planctomycetes bacterium CA13]|uniref:Transcriptional regulatory protein ZraR n=1 Tax=Novipirellula herctigrandis TaxID=2527986 RepID=A0A5C5Z3I8_9BACT|nr:Transcriptional regulatory protein ZraR [Planctomycetes bacterium CA13]
MTAGTKIRNLMRLFDASDAPVWAIGPDGKLVYLSAATAVWLGIDVETLLDRRAVAGSPVSDDPMDQLAATLSAPPGLLARGTASLRVQPHLPSKSGSPAVHRIESLDVRFVRIGQNESTIVFAIGGDFDDRTTNEDLTDAALIRQQLDTWRKRHSSIATIATVGTSLASRRTRSRLQVAASVRSHLGFFGPTGSASESIARHIHHANADREPLVMVDGPLMDPELLDASIVSAINQLTDSPDALATVIVRELDDMPIDAQRHLVHLVDLFDDRFRVIGLCCDKPTILNEALIEERELPHKLSIETDAVPRQLISDLVEMVGALTITLEPLASRVKDIPLLASAILDARRAAGEGRAERIGRAAMDSLVVYPWPSNFDELDAAIRHAIRIAPGDSIGPEHLPLAIRSYHPHAKPQSEKVTTISLDKKLEAYEMKMIESALEATDGNRAAAARALGITRSRLIRRIEAELKSKDEKSS